MYKIEASSMYMAGERGRVFRRIDRRPARLPRPGNKVPRAGRLRMSEQRDFVTSVDESMSEHVYDPLDSAIMERRHGKLGISC
jgi:hypothetical protein